MVWEHDSSNAGVPESHECPHCGFRYQNFCYDGPDEPTMYYGLLDGEMTKEIYE